MRAQYSQGCIRHVWNGLRINRGEGFHGPILELHTVTFGYEVNIVLGQFDQYIFFTMFQTVQDKKALLVLLYKVGT